MSSFNDGKNNSGTTGSITLKSFAELANVLDLESLPPGPPDTDDEIPSAVDSATTQTEPPVIDEPSPISSTQVDLARLIAQLATLSSGLETMARQDARAREQATVELAQYEALAAERREAERALADARRVRATAELLVTEAFSEQARADAARHAGVARAAELTCTRLLAERIRAADELASRPHLARVVAERRQREQEHAEAAERAEAERKARLASGIAAARQARHEGRLDEARELLVSLVGDFPSNQEVRSVLEAVRWQAHHLRVAPAEEALGDASRRPYRDNPEAAVARLAAVDMHELPEDLARRIFGLWSNSCSKLVRQAGMHEPRRYSPATSRGVVMARRTPDGPYEVVSALGLPGWPVGEDVTAQRIIDAARPLQER
ncbi:MAG: hypothetical protein JO023_15845 [Chloroflexi bacterium]|nr:hypothetical protein [Chloroflexota bacterium]